MQQFFWCANNVEIISIIKIHMKLLQSQGLDSRIAKDNCSSKKPKKNTSQMNNNNQYSNNQMNDDDMNEGF